MLARLWCYLFGHERGGDWTPFYALGAKIPLFWRYCCPRCGRCVDVPSTVSYPHEAS